jgi:hypothetical protein
LHYQFQLRGDLTGGDLNQLVNGKWGGGGGFAVIFGEEEAHLRLRLDGDTFQQKNNAGNIQTYGVGADFLYDFASTTDTTFYLSLGLALQQWNFYQTAQIQFRENIHVKAAGRVEVGLWLHSHVGVCTGLLVGNIGPGQVAQNAYVGLNLHF